ncbi:hypothetical protein ACLEIY_04255 [Acetobacter tropicalis]|uniref:hypothetical protein n=2 Tax=Acetobacter tropicalis TaxID=104102 RepID=UPI0039765C0C
MPGRKQTEQPEQKHVLSRRMMMAGLFSGLYSVASVSTARAGSAIPAPLIVAGVAESQCGQWASLLAPILANELQYSSAFPLTTTTGWDGVTGANLFDTQQEQATPPAGLMVPGTAILAALAGDSRVHYDYQRWVPTFLSHQPTVVVGKAALHRSVASILKGQPLRVGVSRYTGPELPTLLALDLLGMRPLPLTGFGTAEAALQALRAGTVDVIQLPFDVDFSGRMAALQEDGFLPLFSNAPANSPFLRQGLPLDFNTVFTQERHRTPNALLYQAWSATATATAIKAGLMLPILSLPATVAQWRHASQIAAASHDLKAHARDENQIVLTGSACTSAYATMMPDLSVVLALRRWLAFNVPRWRDAPLAPAAAQQHAD